MEAIFHILIWDCGTACVKKIFYMCVCVCVLVLPLARELLNSGVSPDLVNEDGLTALHQVNKKHSKTLKLQNQQPRFCWLSRPTMNSGTPQLAKYHLPLFCLNWPLSSGILQEHADCPSLRVRVWRS